MTATKNLTERIVELLKDDKELHDAAVRFLNAYAESTEISNKIRKERNEERKAHMFG